MAFLEFLHFKLIWLMVKFSHRGRRLRKNTAIEKDCDCVTELFSGREAFLKVEYIHRERKDKLSCLYCKRVFYDNGTTIFLHENRFFEIESR